MRVLQWSVRAQADLADFDAYYRPMSTDYVLRALRSAIKAGEFLCEYPQAGAATRRRGLRKWRVPGTPLLLLYRYSRTDITITRVAHDAQNWSSW